MKATFAMGCFWKPQLIFSQITGVVKTKVGYTGGSTKNPTYEEVCSGRSGHAEAIEIEFNQKTVDYKKLLEIFFKNHNPTTLNRQGLDIGAQYRSVIFYHSDKQKEQAEKAKIEAQKNYKFRKIKTEIVKAKEFYPAEEYHQDYLKKHGQTTCKIN